MDPRIPHRADSGVPSLCVLPPRMSGDQTAQDPGYSLGELDQHVRGWKSDSKGLGREGESEKVS